MPTASLTDAPALAPSRAAGIPLWHLVISGFTQKLEHPNGCQNLWNAIRRARRDCYEAATRLDPWNSDWAGIAELVWRFRPTDRPPAVFVYAYSWGGGWGFPQLAEQLADRGIEIEHAVLSDAVYKSPLRLLAPLSLTPWPEIRVPENVREVDWFYTRNGLPAGHKVVAANPKRTLINPGVLMPGVTHHYADDQPCWWLKSLEVASSARAAEPPGSLLARLDAAHG